MKNFRLSSYFVAAAMVLFSFFDVNGQSCPVLTDNGSNSITLTFSTPLASTITLVEITSGGVKTYSGARLSGATTTEVTIVNLGNDDLGATGLTSGSTASQIEVTGGASVRTCTQTIPLPVTLTKFNATLSNNNVILNWATANEINNDKFDVERSSNGIDFVKVGEVKGKGNSTVLNTYTFVDNSVQVASESKLFYRLKQHDFNGDFEYSKITLVKLDRNINQVKVYPNPSNHMVTVDIVNPESMSSKIEIIGLDGISYFTMLTEKSSEELDISELSKGVYFVRVTGADDMPSVQRLIIQ